MIESKEQVVNGFREKAREFLQSPNLMTGLALDDATVTLKRYVLSEMKDQPLASTLARFPKLIRMLDVASLGPLVDEVEQRLDAS
jgi:hypothetical protein